MAGSDDRFRARTIARSASWPAAETAPPSATAGASGAARPTVDSGAFLQGLIEHGLQRFVVLDQRGTFRYVSGGALVLGYRPQELIGRGAVDLIHPDEARAATNWLDELIQRPGGVAWLLCRARHKRGSWHRLEALVENCLDDPAVGGVIASVGRTSRRSRPQARICRYRRQLRDLTRQLTSTEERQRQRIATDLHDDLGQCLALAKMKLDALSAEAPPRRKATEIETVARLISQAVQTTRSLTLRLNPPVLADPSLAATLRWLAGQMASDYGLAVRIADDGQDQALAADCRVLLFRAVRELLINVVKHAGVREATVALQHRGRCVCITVTDAGAGFDTAGRPPPSTQTGGFGLLDLGRRLAGFGGRLEIQAQPGGGTQVTLVAPLSGAADDL